MGKEAGGDPGRRGWRPREEGGGRAGGVGSLIPGLVPGPRPAAQPPPKEPSGSALLTSVVLLFAAEGDSLASWHLRRRHGNSRGARQPLLLRQQHGARSSSLCRARSPPCSQAPSPSPPCRCPVAGPGPPPARPAPLHPAPPGPNLPHLPAATCAGSLPPTPGRPSLKDQGLARAPLLRETYTELASWVGTRTHRASLDLELLGGRPFTSPPEVQHTGQGPELGSRVGEVKMLRAALIRAVGRE